MNRQPRVSGWMVAALLALWVCDAAGQSAQTQALLDEGDHAFERKAYDKAAKLFDRAINAEPKTIDATYFAKRADIFIFLRRYADGLKWLAGTAEPHQGGSALLQARKAILLHGVGRADDAIALAEQVIARDPRAYALHLLIGDHHFKTLANARRAVQAYAAFLDSRPPALAGSDSVIWLRLGFAQLYAGAAAEALDSFVHVDQSEGRRVGLGRCAALTALGRWTDAARVCTAAAGAERARAPAGRTAAPRGPAPDASPLYNLAKARLMLGRRAQALTAVDSFLEQKPRSLKGLLLRGEIMAAEGQIGAAEQLFEQARALAPDSPDVAMRIGRLQLGRRDARPDLAVPHLERAHQAYPDDDDLAFDLASAYLAGGRPRDAEELARRGAERARGKLAQARFLALQGDAAAAEGGDPARAASLYEAALSADPGQTRARSGVVKVLNRMAAASFAKGERDTTKQLLERAVEHDPKAAITNFNLGLALLDQGDAPGALERLQAAAVAAPMEPRVHFVLARASATAGEADAALRYQAAQGLARRAEDVPLLVEVLTDLGTLHLRARRIDEAVRVLAEAYQLGGGKQAPVATRRNRQLALLRHGLALLADGKVQAAEADLEHVLAEPELLQGIEGDLASFGRALAWLRMGRASRAREVLTGLERRLGKQAVPWLRPPYDQFGLAYFVAVADYVDGDENALERANRALARLALQVQQGKLANEVRDLQRSTLELLAQERFQKGDVRAAERRLEEARRFATAGTRGHIEHNLAVLALARRPAAARKTFERLGDNPPEALANLGILLDAAGEPEQAYRLWLEARSKGVSAPQLEQWLERKKGLFEETASP